VAVGRRRIASGREKCVMFAPRGRRGNTQAGSTLFSVSVVSIPCSFNLVSLPKFVKRILAP